MAHAASGFVTSGKLPLAASRARASSPQSLRMQQSDEIKILDRVEKLRVLTALSKAGVLSKVEKAGVLSSLEQAGALSKVEPLLPLADKYKVISLTKGLLNTSPSTFSTFAFLALAAAGATVAVVPDESGPLVVAQGLVGVSAAAAAAAFLTLGKVVDVATTDQELDLSALAGLLGAAAANVGVAEPPKAVSSAPGAPVIAEEEMTLRTRGPFPPGPQGRGPFGPEDEFVLPDGRTYVPGDAATDDLYGAALAEPFKLSDSAKGIVAASTLGFAVGVPFLLIKVVGGY